MRTAGLILAIGLLVLVIVLAQPVRGAAPRPGAGRPVEARRLQAHVETISGTAIRRS